MKRNEIHFPPKSLSELRRVPNLIHQGELALSIGHKSLKALNQMLDNPQMVALSNINELSRQVGVSPASLTRLAKLLGYRGFNPFQQVFRRQLRQPEHFYSRQADRLMLPQQEQGVPLLEQLANQAAENIQQTLARVNQPQLEQAVEWLAESPRVQILGYRQSSALASMMSYGLGMIRSQVNQLGVSGHGLSIGMAQLQRQDTLVVIGSAPYSQETVKAARLAQQQEQRMIAITDSHHSPLNLISSVSLQAPTGSLFYSNSFIALQFLIEGLLSLTARRLGRRALRNLHTREELINRLNDEY